jgi:histidinol dehydrogenase
VGDYVAGPSHVLPTAGTARFASPLSVATFRRRMSVLDLSPQALAAVAPAVDALAAAEGFEGHARAVRIRVAAQKAAPSRRRSPRSGGRGMENPSPRSGVKQKARPSPRTGGRELDDKRKAISR